jgi:class 3 adenylate cyclase
MHNILKKALPEAEGRSEFVVVVVADIRGFSEFSTRRESPDTAMYIKRVYVQLISRYFPNASFYKPTGDGLLITITYNDKTLQAVAGATVAACLRCVEEFANICQGDPMINFEVPTRIGFGIAKGTACCLTSGGLVLDYSGHLLNLTSRLMDLARPSGVVIDGEFGLGLLSDEQQSLFEEDRVCVRSVAEETPRRVYVQKGVVEIPEAARRPLRLEDWNAEEVEMTVHEWRMLASRFDVVLPKKLKRADGIEVRIHHPKFRGRSEMPGISTYEPARFEYVLQADRPCVALDVEHLVGYLRGKRIPPTTKVKVVIRYVPE